MPDPDHDAPRTRPARPPLGPSRQYLTTLAVVVAMVVAGLALPLLLGERVEEGDVAAVAPNPRFEAGDGQDPDDPTAGAGFGTTTTTAPDGAPGAPGPGGAVGAPSTGGPGAAPGPGGAPAPGGAGPAPATGGGRTASDQGVTPDAVRVGIAVTELQGIGELGLADVPTPAEQEQTYRWYIDAVNAAGGVNGRLLDPVFVTVGNPDSQRAGCRALTEDAQVFAALHVLGIYGDPILCFTEEHGVPYLSWDGVVADHLARSDGLLFTTQPSTRKTSLNMVQRVADLGLTEGEVLGVLHYDGYLAADMAALIDHARSLGNRVVTSELSVSDASRIPGQLAVAVQRFQSEGVDRIFLMTNALYGAQFAAQAERQLYRPAYALSDFDYVTAGDTFLESMPDGFFRDAVVVTSTRWGESRVGIAETPVDAQCRAIYEAGAGESIDRDTTKGFQATSVCGLVQTLVLGLQRAGTNPTRRSFSDGLRSLGSFPNPGFGPSSFGPDKSTGPDVVRVARASLDCRCWVPEEGFVPNPFGGS